VEHVELVVLFLLVAVAGLTALARVLGVPWLPVVPQGSTKLVLGGRGLAIAGWVHYQEGSVLSYGELFAAVVGRFVGAPPRP
jgi:hypothetical protein